jgi:hypothetical protein
MNELSLIITSLTGRRPEELLSIAVRAHSSSAVALLRDYGWNLATYNEEGYTAYLDACRYGMIPMSYIILYRLFSFDGYHLDTRNGKAVSIRCGSTER